MKFSQRMGITPLVKEVQKDDMDEDLRNSLWNVFYSLLLDRLKDYPSRMYKGEIPIEYFRLALYHQFYKQPTDRAPEGKGYVIRDIRIRFFSEPWYKVYDLIQFAIVEVKEPYYEIDTKSLIPIFNSILEREFSAYRFIGDQLSPITNETEINEITEANKNTASTALKGCNIHLTTALNLLSDRKNPDYRNSIKESISAIESLVKVISGNNKDSLGGAIDKIKSKIALHPALEKGFKQIYGYTSDSNGIRHGLMEEPNCDFEDAKYMLVSCSAFINYLIVKANKVGISLS